MKIKTSELTGWQLAYAAAQHDPMCASLRWEKRDGVVFGVFDDDSKDEGRLTCCFLGDLNVIERLRIRRKTSAEFYAPQELWQQGGPIIERENLGQLPPDGHRFGAWCAFYWTPSQHDLAFDDSVEHKQWGATPLIAAMRCFVAAKLGDEVEVPDELL